MTFEFPFSTYRFRGYISGNGLENKRMMINLLSVYFSKSIS
ncbi:hypothetical protein M072_3108 [Bacteroides fragilis str. DS-208]|nr:hypothetical protein M072_3108 [Bacteroides fragilis str. DS-208]